MQLGGVSGVVRKFRVAWLALSILGVLMGQNPAVADEMSAILLANDEGIQGAETLANRTTAEDLDLPPATVEGSPVLQDWLEAVPDVLSEIRNRPSFRTRIQASYTEFPSSNQTGGVAVGIEDWFIGRTPLTVSGDYQRNFEGNREAYGANLRYYVLPLGSYVNVAPLVGYRSVRTAQYNQDGLNVGFQVKVIPSRGGGADFAYTQTWIDPTGSETVGTTELEFGYALTDRLRLATELEWQFAPGNTDSAVGIGVEWML